MSMAGQLTMSAHSQEKEEVMKNILIIALMLVFSVAGIAKAEEWCGKDVESRMASGNAKITVKGVTHEFRWYASSAYGVVLCISEKLLMKGTWTPAAKDSPFHRSKPVDIPKYKLKFYLQFVASTTNAVIYQLVVVSGKVSNLSAMRLAMKEMGFTDVSFGGWDVTVGKLE